MADVRNIQGLDALQRFFKAFPLDVGKTVLRKGAGAGAQVVKDFVGPRTPIGSSRKGHVGGTLRRALRVVYRREKSNDGQAVFAVTFRKGKGAQGKLNKKGTFQTLSADAFYAFWVDQGHRIVGRPARGAKKQTRRARRLAATGRFEGVNFFLPAFTSSRDAAEEAMVKSMQDEARSLIK